MTEEEALLRRRIVDEARSWIGTPYRHQAATKGAGADCLGLVRGVYRAIYGFEPEDSWPRYTSNWAESGGVEELMAALDRHGKQKPIEARTPGDVLLFRWRADLPCKHIAILATDATMIHAHSRLTTMEVSLSVWLPKVAGVYAMPGCS